MALVDCSRMVRVFKNHREQEDEARRYWLGKSIEEKMEKTAALVRCAYSHQGIDVDAQKPEELWSEFNAHGVEYLIVRAAFSLR